MSKYTKKGEREIISVATFIFFQQAHNGGLCKFIEKDNLDQSTRHFKKGAFDHETNKLTIEFDNETTVISLPKNFGVEFVEPENNPDHLGYHRMGVWDYNNIYVFDAQWSKNKQLTEER